MAVILPHSPLITQPYLGDFVDPDAEADIVVADLDRVLAHIAEVQATIETYKVWIMDGGNQV